MRFPVTSRGQNALFRHVAAPGRCGATPRQAAGHYGECLNWANALEQPPASLRGGLCQGPQISVRSLALRKGALCPTGGLQNAPFRRMRFSSPGQTSSHLTEKRTLQPTQPQQCTQMPQNGSERPFSPICVHSLSPRPLVRPGRATGPTTSTAPWPRDARVLGPEAHAAGAAAHLRCQALLSPLVALECHRHGMCRMPEQGQFGWSSRLARFNAWGL